MRTIFYSFFAVIVSLLCISFASAATVPWDRTQVGTQVPLYGDGILVTASSTFLGNVTAASLSNGCIQTVNGLLTSTGSACLIGSGSNWIFTPSQTAITPTTTVGILVVASSTIGNGILGLTISGPSTTTGTAIFPVGTVSDPSVVVGGVFGGPGIYLAAASTLGLSNGAAGLSWNGNAFYPNTSSVRDLGIDTTNLWNRAFINYASTTALSATTICLTSDCRTTWPTGAAFPFTPTTNYNTAVNSTSTPIWFTNGLMASSTARLTYASTTALTVSGDAYFPSGIWNSSGNVGIGSTTPSAALTVGGGNIWQTAGTPTKIGSLATGDSVYVSAVQGKYLYLGEATTTSSGLQIVDISIPATPTIVGTYDSPGHVRGIAVSGKYAYLSANVGTGGRMIADIVDISNPSTPVSVGSVVVATAGQGGGQVALSGGYMFIGGRGGGGNFINVVNVANPTAPVVTKIENVGTQVTSIVVNGTYLYLTSNTSHSFKIYDISNPADPTLVSNTVTATGGSQNGLYVSGRYAYGVMSANLLVFDVSNPKSPTVVSTTTLASTGTGISVAGNYAYVSTNATGDFQVFDISNPAAPVQVGSAAPMTSAGSSISIAGQYAYVTETTAANGVEVYKISGALLPAASIGTIDSNRLNISEALTLDGDAYISGGLNLGISGLFSRGALNVFTASTSASTPISALFNGGFVGIGTTSPYAKFSLHANNGETNATLFAIGSSTASATTTLFAIHNTGAVQTVLADGCVQAASGILTSTGSACSSGGGGTFPFTPTTFGSTAANATSTLIGFTQGIYALASSTIGGGTSTSGLTISGNATTTGTHFFSNSPVIAYGAKYNGLVNTGAPSNGGFYPSTSGFIGSNATVVQYGSGGNNLVFAHGSTMVGTFSSTDNFGIASTSPWAKLSVHAAATDTNNTLFAIGSSTASATTTLFKVDNTGVITSNAAATSTFAKAIQSTCFTTNGTTCITGGAASGADYYNTGTVRAQNSPISIVAGDRVKMWYVATLSSGCSTANDLVMGFGYKLGTFAATTTAVTAGQGAGSGDRCSVAGSAMFTATTTDTIAPAVFDVASDVGADFTSVMTTVN